MEPVQSAQEVIDKEWTFPIDPNRKTDVETAATILAAKNLAALVATLGRIEAQLAVITAPKLPKQKVVKPVLIPVRRAVKKTAKKKA